MTGISQLTVVMVALFIVAVTVLFGLMASCLVRLMLRVRRLEDDMCAVVALRVRRLEEDVCATKSGKEVAK